MISSLKLAKGTNEELRGTIAIARDTKSGPKVTNIISKGTNPQNLSKTKPAPKKRLVQLDFDEWRRDVSIGLMQVHEFPGDDPARAEGLVHAHVRQVFHIVVFA